jgi:3-phytase
MTLIALTFQVSAYELPNRVGMAKEIAVLPGGHWLALNKHQLSLIDGRGDPADSLAIRGAHLDSRPATLGARAVVFDENEQQAIVLDVDLAKRKILADIKVPRQPFTVKTQCLYRDAQQHDHLFLIGRDGQAEQWIISGEQPRLLRQLAVPPGVEHCRVDDTSDTLYVSEEAFGVWAYPANGEGKPSRTLVAAGHPYGQLRPDIGALTVLPDGLAILDTDGDNLSLLYKKQDQWYLSQTLNVVETDQLLASSGQLAIRSMGRWQMGPLWWPRAKQSDTKLPIVRPQNETTTVNQMGDSADDPAIWINSLDHNRSRVVVTDKKQGVLVYDLQGQQKQFLDVGRVNNVDLRHQIKLGERRLDLALATQRDENSLVVFEIDTEGNLRDAGHIPTNQEDIYGICLYQPPEGGLEVFVNDKSGTYVQYAITLEGGDYVGKAVRRFNMRGLAEGCVVDDRRKRLFIAEEDYGIWTLPADASVTEQPRSILPVGGQLSADVEGLAIYYGQKSDYLIASSQGNSSFAVLDAKPPYAYHGSFRIGINLELGIDGVSDTDGLEVSALDFGGSYGEGMLIVQDGYNQLPSAAQNFKYVPWGDIARALHLQ